MPWNTLRSWLNPSTTSPKRTSWRAVLLNLENLENRITPSFTVGPNINISKSAVENAETSIVVNPTNPLNLFATSTADGSNFYSVDGGVTWLKAQLATGGGPNFTGGDGGDQQEAWDNFGNLFL